MSQICHAHNCRAVQKNETHPILAILYAFCTAYAILWGKYNGYGESMSPQPIAENTLFLGDLIWRFQIIRVLCSHY